MENFYLFTELVKIIKEEKHVFERELAILKEKQTRLSAEQEKITNEIRDKERQLASISEEKITEYQRLWNLSPYVCPLCFFFNDRQSPLQPLPERNGKDHCRCKVCGQWFHIPLPLP